MKIKTSVVCKCGSKQNVQMIKPGMFRPSIGSFFCSDCESKIAYYSTRIPRNPSQISISTKILEVSEVLKEILKEESLSEIGKE